MNKRKTPMMGWSSWNAYRTLISEEIIMHQADRLVELGLDRLGYTYVNTDDGFFGGRDENGRMVTRADRFPNGLKPMADHIHSLGLKAGIYSDAGANTCGYQWDSFDVGARGFGVGLYGREESDLRRYLIEDGFDFIKVDWCGGLTLGLDEETQYTKIGKIIETIRQETGRDILFNICRWQFPGPWAPKVGDSWRTGADITEDFASLLFEIDKTKLLAQYCMPGHFNDPDAMQLGKGAFSEEEEKTHFTMWCMLNAPLTISCDLDRIPESTVRILSNTELIAVDQDPAAIQAVVGKEFRKENALVGEVYVKDLGSAGSGTKAICFLNRSTEALYMEATWEELGFEAVETYEIRDLWAHQALPEEASFGDKIPAHGVRALLVTAKAGTAKAAPMVTRREDAGTGTITGAQARELVQQGAILLDARDEEDFNTYHIEGAIRIYYQDILREAPEKLPDPDQDIVVYCNSGKKSAMAVQLLQYLGYTKVHDLAGYQNYEA